MPAVKAEDLKQRTDNTIAKEKEQKDKHVWHPSCYYCYKPGHKLYSFVFSIFNFSAGNILSVSFDWMDTVRFYMSMCIVIAKIHDEYYWGMYCSWYIYS